jgi:hypothetical protein
MKHLRPFLTVSLALVAASLLSVAADSTVSAKEAYPLTTCVVSGEPLEGGDMGGPIDYIHKEAGQPDRLVRFCCKACLKDFKKAPAKYLKQIDEAATAATRPVEQKH